MKVVDKIKTWWRRVHGKSANKKHEEIHDRLLAISSNIYTGSTQVAYIRGNLESVNDGVLRMGRELSSCESSVRSLGYSLSSIARNCAESKNFTRQQTAAMFIQGMLASGNKFSRDHMIDFAIDMASKLECRMCEKEREEDEKMRDQIIESSRPEFEIETDGGEPENEGFF